MLTRITLILLLSTLTLTRAQSPALTPQAAEARYQEELAKLTAERDERDKALVQHYVGELMRFEIRCRNNSDLDGVLAARTEIQRVELEGAAPPAEPAAHEGLRQLQNLMLEQSNRHARMKGEKLLELLQGITQFAATRAMEETRANDIPAAIAWRDWSQDLQNRPEVLRARAHTQAAAPEAQPPPGGHPAVNQRPVAEVLTRPVQDFVDHPRVFVLGNEPGGREPRQMESTPGAAGSGHTLLQGRLRLVDEEDTLNRYSTPWSSYRQRAHLYVPRLQFTPLPGRNIGETLVVFDLFKRGSGSVREIIRTDAIRLPPVPNGAQVVVDAGVYAYQSERYRASYAGGVRSDQATAELFHGFIVTLFDRDGRILYQRSNDRGLNNFARTEPPPHQEPPPPPPEAPPPPPVE